MLFVELRDRVTEGGEKVVISRKYVAWKVGSREVRGFGKLEKWKIMKGTKRLSDWERVRRINSRGQSSVIRMDYFSSFKIGISHLWSLVIEVQRFLRNPTNGLSAFYTCTEVNM